MEQHFFNLLEDVSLKDVVYFVLGFLTVVSIFVEKLKSIPFHPWTHFFEWLGNCTNKNIYKQLGHIEAQQEANKKALEELDEKVDTKFAEKQRSDDEKEAKRLRANIIMFADSCRVGNRHTQNHFQNVMRDYSDYIKYCEEHDLPNHFIDSEYGYIEDIYRECLKANKFI